MNVMKFSSAAALLAASNLAYAIPAVYSQAEAGAFSPVQDMVVTDPGTSSGSTSAASAVTAAPGAAARAAGAATFGTVRAHAYGSTTDARTSSRANASAGFRDGIKLVNNALTGQTGQVSLAFYYDYAASYSDSLSPESSTSGQVSFTAHAGDQYANLLDFNFTGDSVNRGFSRIDARGTVTDFTGYSGLLYLTTTFIWGEYFNIGLDVETLGLTQSVEDIAFSFANDASNGSYWDGVQSVVTGGSVVDSFTIVSESGIDYSASFVPDSEIPEPATYLLWLAGAGMMVSVRKLTRR